MFAMPHDAGNTQAPKTCFTDPGASMAGAHAASDSASPAQQTLAPHAGASPEETLQIHTGMPSSAVIPGAPGPNHRVRDDSDYHPLVGGTW